MYVLIPTTKRESLHHIQWYGTEEAPLRLLSNPWVMGAVGQFGPTFFAHKGIDKASPLHRCHNVNKQEGHKQTHGPWWPSLPQLSRNGEDGVWTSFMVTPCWVAPSPLCTPLIHVIYLRHGLGLLQIFKRKSFSRKICRCVLSTTHHFTLHYSKTNMFRFRYASKTMHDIVERQITDLAPLIF